MPIYRCPRCGYSSHIKTYLRKHFLRKRPCSQLVDIPTIEECFREVLGENIPIEPKLNPIEPKLNPIEPKSNISKKYQCIFCQKCYSTNSHMHRHMKKCKFKNSPKLASNSDAKDILINELIKERDQMRKSIETLLERVGNVTHITNNNQQTIFINSHGQENLSYINDRYLMNLLKTPYGAVPKLLKDIHFHPEHPENMNVLITNKKLKFAKVWKGDKWKLCDKNEVIENMVDKGFNIIDGKFVEKEKVLESSKIKNYTEFQKRYNDGDKHLHKELLKNTEMVILNNS